MPTYGESSTTDGKVQGKRAAFGVDAVEGGERVNQEESPTPASPAGVGSVTRREIADQPG